MAMDPDGMTPKASIREYLDGLFGLKDSTVQNHRVRLAHFQTWCESEDLSSMGDLGRHHVRRYQSSRAGEVETITLAHEMMTLKQFLHYCANIGAVSMEVAEAVRAVHLDVEDEVDDTMLAPEDAEAIRTQFHQNAFATRPHVIFEIFWHTGIRLSTIRALDIDDFESDLLQRTLGDAGKDSPDGSVFEPYLELKHRPETGTELKNDLESERQINLSVEVADVIRGWLTLHHPGVEDEHGRMPLIGTQFGRAAGETIRESAYRLTRPCEFSGVCPHNRDSSCPGRRSKRAYACPSSVSPHPIRKGSITHHLNRGVPPEVVGARADVSQEVLDKHYDHGTEAEKRTRRRKFLDRL